jgi:hypothetical protein
MGTADYADFTNWKRTEGALSLFFIRVLRERNGCPSRRRKKRMGPVANRMNTSATIESQRGRI